MSNESYTEVTRQSWGSRLKGSLRGIVVGLILIAVAVWLLFTNEGRAVRRAKSLTEGGGAVVSVPADRVDPAHEGKLVHVSGTAATDEILQDPTFGVAVNALHLERQVEMYQWRENRESKTEKKLGGGTETRTTYSYQKVWSDRPIDSSGFKRPDGHANPGSFRYGPRKVSASRVSLGAFRLPSSVVERLGNFQPLEISSRDALPAELRYGSRLQEGGVYVGLDPSHPEVGDLRIRFAYVPPGPVSVVAQQVGDSFSPYATSAGGTIELVRSGVASAEAMFAAAQRSNRILTWLLRGGGFLLMFFGIGMVLRPLSVLADVVPFVGNLVEAGTGFLAFLLAAFGALLVVSIAWLFYRPLLGLSVLALAILVVVWIVRRMGRAKRRVGAPTPTPARTVPPPPPPPAS
jgi:Na+-transporting methylmalonyl-CoA/oxaloacetate decarboxylase gamma subunit